MRGPVILCVLLAVEYADALGGPQQELARLAQPWQRAGAWLTGAHSKQQRRTLQEAEEHLTAEEKEIEAEEEAIEESHVKWGFVVGILGLGLTFIGGYILEQHHVVRLPEAGVGLLVGAAAAYGAIAAGDTVMAHHDRFDFEFFMTWLLPPIIFEAGFNMNVKHFLANLGPTMFYAFVGTFASTFVVGGLVWYAGQLGLCYPLGMLASLTFGSLISATDPVTVLAVFQALGVKVDLFSMVFGESVLNDAVAIVLSRTLLSFNKPGTVVDAESLQGAFISFCTIFGGSLLIGAFFGILSARVFKAMDMRHHSELVFMQSALSFAFPWAAYFTSEALELSGIVTILFCGMIMATYTRYNFSPEARVLTAQAYKCVAVVAETYVFVYLGMAVFTFPIFKSTTWMLIVAATLACFVGRLHIYVGSWITNCLRGPESDPPRISGTYMFIMWFSGLRGGVAFALASVSFADNDFPDLCGGLTEEAKIGVASCYPSTGMSDSLAILQTTLVIAAFTIFVFGGAITEVCRAGGVLEGKQAKSKDDDDDAVDDGHHDFLSLMPWLTLPGAAKDLKQENSARFGPAVEHAFAPAAETPRPASYVPAPSGPGMHTSEITAKLAGEVEMASLKRG